MRWEIINKRNLSEKMKKMQEEAIKEARATQAKCNVGTKEALKNIELNENKNSHKDNSPKKGYSLDFINKIFSSNDNVLIIILIILLMDDEKNFLLLIVLIYILM